MDLDKQIEEARQMFADITFRCNNLLTQRKCAVPKVVYDQVYLILKDLIEDHDLLQTDENRLILQQIEELREAAWPSRFNSELGRSRHGYIYLVKGPKGSYKIGRALNVDDRIKTFTVKLPFPIKLIHIIESDDYIGVERHLHHRYRDRRINGEWFALTKTDIAEIKGWERL